MQIENSVFLVTGAGSGLGAATARMVVSAGGRVLIADVNRQGGEGLAAELGVDLAVARFGTVHCLVTCAGIAPAEKVVGRDGPHRLESFIRVVQVNLIGVFNMLRLAAVVMNGNEPNAEGERGVIINTASISAFEGQIGQAAYGASKGGVVGMTLPIARELCRSGIRVNTIAPGIMETPMVLGMPAEVQESLGKMVPFPPRLGKPSEFAALVRHIAENGYINGEVIRIDGAIRMGAK